MGSQVLITGAAGFVGTHVIYELIQSNYVPLALDNRGEALKGKYCSFSVFIIYIFTNWTKISRHIG